MAPKDEDQVYYSEMYENFKNNNTRENTSNWKEKKVTHTKILKCFSKDLQMVSKKIKSWQMLVTIREPQGAGTSHPRAELQ